MARTGRRPGPNTTRNTLLAIARRRFGEAGYGSTSMRAIAAEAGVDPSVIAHFFGSKDGLFRAAVGWPFDPAVVAGRLGDQGPGGMGAGVATVFFGVWDDPVTRPSMLAMLRSAMSHETSATLLGEFVSRHLFAKVSALLRGPDSQLRVNLAASHLIGVAVLRYGLRIEPIASARTDTLITWLTPALNRYLQPGSARRASNGEPKRDRA